MIIDGIDIAIVKKRNKNIILHVKSTDGSVWVSAPHRVNADTIRLFVLKKMDWLKRKIQAFRDRPPITELQYVTGEQHLLWGQLYRLQVMDRLAAEGVCLTDSSMILFVRDNATFQHRKHILTEWYRRQLKKQMLPQVDVWQKRIGVEAFCWQVRNMKSRWGSCNTRAKKICVSLQLAKMPFECLQYVIVHELCHLLVPDHSADFKQLMDHYLPDWRDRRKLLKN